MKQQFLFLTVILSLLALSPLKAQITIESSDMPSENDIVPVSTGLNVDFIDFTETGENFIWDFSALMPVSQKVDTFMKVMDTPFWFYFFYFSNLAKPSPFAIPVPNLPITNVYEYYNKSGSKYEYTGYGSNLFGIPFPVLYTSPDIVYRFPMQYGNEDSCTSGLNAGIDNIGYMLVDRFRKNIVDGWGTLTTPYGTFDVLRIKSEVSEYDSIYVDSLNTGIPVNRNYTEYKWLAKNGKEPLLTISSSSFGAVVTYVDSLHLDPNGMNKKEYNPVKLYPNPSKGKITVFLNENLHAPFKWELRTLSGKKAGEGEITRPVHSFTFDFSGKSGTFLLILNGKNFRIVKKVIINK